VFNDFEDSAGEEKSSGRRAASLGVAAVILLLLGSGVAAALATVRVAERQREQEVSFADLPLPPPAPVEAEAPPPPPPPPPPPRQARRDRPAGQRPVLDGPPSGIPDEIPEEADGELRDTVNTGPIENDATMGEGGEGDAPPVEEPTPAPTPVAPAPRPPEQVRETIRRARYLANRSACRRIDIPDDIAASLGAQTIRVRVRALVDVDGTVRSVSVTNGHSLIPDELFIRCAEQWVFAPATLPDGTAVPYPAIRTFVIRPRT
jgi:protein TonB